MVKKGYWLFIGVLLWALLGCSGGQDKAASVTDAQIQTIATSFGEYIAQKNYATAYKLTSTSYQNSTTEQAFGQEINRWIAETGIRNMAFNANDSGFEKASDTAGQVGWAYLTFDGTFKGDDGDFEDHEALALVLVLENGQLRVQSIQLGRAD